MTKRNLNGNKVGHPFYNSAKWRKVRSSYLETKHWICEKCGRPAGFVHHIDELKESDYFENYEKCYGFANLMALCRDCHDRMPNHFLGHLGRQAIADGFKVDMKTGDIVPISPRGVGVNFGKESR